MLVDKLVKDLGFFSSAEELEGNCWLVWMPGDLEGR